MIFSEQHSTYHGSGFLEISLQIGIQDYFRDNIAHLGSQGNIRNIIARRGSQASSRNDFSPLWEQCFFSEQYHRLLFSTLIAVPMLYYAG